VRQATTCGFNAFAENVVANYDVESLVPMLPGAPLVSAADIATIAPGLTVIIPASVSSLLIIYWIQLSQGTSGSAGNGNKLPNVINVTPIATISSTQTSSSSAACPTNTDGSGGPTVSLYFKSIHFVFQALINS
jgi:hypothetical protein